MIKLVFANIKLTLGQNKIKFQTGTPQGSLISPILFDLYINDLLTELTDKLKFINVKAFADDIMFICHGRSETE